MKKGLTFSIFLLTVLTVYYYKKNEIISLPSFSYQMGYPIDQEDQAVSFITSNNFFMNRIAEFDKKLSVVCPNKEPYNWESSSLYREKEDYWIVSFTYNFEGIENLCRASFNKKGEFVDGNWCGFRTKKQTKAKCKTKLPDIVIPKLTIQELQNSL